MYPGTGERIQYYHSKEWISKWTIQYPCAGLLGYLKDDLSLEHSRLDESCYGGLEFPRAFLLVIPTLTTPLIYSHAYTGTSGLLRSRHSLQCRRLHTNCACRAGNRATTAASPGVV